PAASARDGVASSVSGGETSLRPSSLKQGAASQMLRRVPSHDHQGQRWDANPGGWTLYGAPWLQTVAIVGKSRSRGSRRNKRKPLRPVATGCLRSPIVSSASAMGWHSLQEVPLPEKGGGRLPGASAGRQASR